MHLHVVRAESIDGHRVHLCFNDGLDGGIDLAGALDGPIFQPLQVHDYFKNFSLTGHTLSWPNGTDFAPEYLHDLVAAGAIS